MKLNDEEMIPSLSCLILHSESQFQYYEYNLDSEYVRVFNMLELQMVLNKILHNIYLTEF